MDPNDVSPGLLGFIIVCIIGLATWFLLRNMAKHLRKLNENRVDQDEAELPDPNDRKVNGTA
ncbi:MAG TPA: hypothetical protein VGX23_25175 [Actinocrinis sp.]|nr:hypothetical protein [Actinocrinis sp.]